MWGFLPDLNYIADHFEGGAYHTKKPEILWDGEYYD